MRPSPEDVGLTVRTRVGAPVSSAPCARRQEASAGTPGLRHAGFKPHPIFIERGTGAGSRTSMATDTSTTSPPSDRWSSVIDLRPSSTPWSGPSATTGPCTEWAIASRSSVGKRRRRRPVLGAGALRQHRYRGRHGGASDGEGLHGPHESAPIRGALPRVGRPGALLGRPPIDLVGDPERPTPSPERPGSPRRWPERLWCASGMTQTSSARPSPTMATTLRRSSASHHGQLDGRAARGRLLGAAARPDDPRRRRPRSSTRRRPGSASRSAAPRNCMGSCLISRLWPRRSAAVFPWLPWAAAGSS